MIEISTIAKGLGFAAFFVTMYGYINKNDNVLRKAIAISAGLLAIHYFMLFAWVAGINLSINFFRNQIATKKSGIRWFLGFGSIQILLGIVFYESYMDLFPIVGSLLSGYAFFCQKGIKMRFLMLLCTLMWLVVNVLLRSYGAVLQDSLSIVMNMIGISRLVKEPSIVEEN